jgi:hypothetical protein
MTPAKEPFDPAPLEVGARYRVDNRHDRLRRTFRTDGTYLGIEDGEDEDGAPARFLRFEVKPRFGKAAVQRIDVSTVVTATPL